MGLGEGGGAVRSDLRALGASSGVHASSRACTRRPTHELRGGLRTGVVTTYAASTRSLPPPGPKKCSRSRSASTRRRIVGGGASSLCARGTFASTSQRSDAPITEMRRCTVMSTLCHETMERSSEKKRETARASCSIFGSPKRRSLARKSRRVSRTKAPALPAGCCTASRLMESADSAGGTKVYAGEGGVSRRHHATERSRAPQRRTGGHHCWGVSAGARSTAGSRQWRAPRRRRLRTNSCLRPTAPHLNERNELGELALEARALAKLDALCCS